MKKRLRALGVLVCMSVVWASGSAAQDKPRADIKDEIEQSEKAAQVFREIMNTPDKAIPKAILDAECVAVFPTVIKAGLGIAGRGGRGIPSCRSSQGWSAPAYFNLGGGSFGLQIGVEATDLVMLFMTDESIKSLLSTKFTLGGDTSVAAGPVGREAGAATDAKLNAQVLSYSRSKGLVAGPELSGVVVEAADDDMRDVYGQGVAAKDVLKGGKLAAPAAVRAFPDTIVKYSPRRAGATSSR